MAAMIRTSTLTGLRAPQAFDHALLEHAEQLDLDFQRQITDLVEEERGLVGGFEPADLPRERARIRALLAAEQLALDEGGRNGRAAHADHRPLMARAEVVHRLRHHLLARSCFAEQQDGGGRGRDLLDLREHVLDGGAFRDHRTRRPQHLHRSRRTCACLHDHAILQPADLVERLLQPVVSGPARKRLTHDAGDETQTFDDDGRPLLFPCHRPQHQGQHGFTVSRWRQTHHGTGSESAATKRVAIGIGQVVHRREAAGFACLQAGDHERERRHRQRRLGSRA